MSEKPKAMSDEPRANRSKDPRFNIEDLILSPFWLLAIGYWLTQVILPELEKIKNPLLVKAGG